MSDRPLNKNRRKHLKNLRKIQKIKRIERTALRREPMASGTNPLVLLGLVLCSAVLLVFLGSILQQYWDKFSISSAASNEDSLPAVEHSTVEVRVLNGCGVPGAGRSMTRFLRDLQFDVVGAENAEHFSYENTLIINHSGRPEVGWAVARALGCHRLREKQDDLALVDVTVILGRDWEQFVKPREEEKKEKTLEKIISKTRSILGLD